MVGVDDLMPQILWMQYFLEDQGFKVSDDIVYQDNQSSMKLEKHRQASSGKQTWHINICNFFVTDRIWENESMVEYCPTEMVVADFYTKPLQGKLFRLFQNMIMKLNDEDVHNIFLWRN